MTMEVNAPSDHDRLYPDKILVINGAGDGGHRGGLTFDIGYLPIFINDVPAEEVLAELRALRERVAELEG
jgi:hypothetical protein